MAHAHSDPKRNHLLAVSTPNRAVVQSAGKGFRMRPSVLQDEFKHAPVMHLLLRYTAALMTQMAQTAVCNRHHSLDQQLCRWLLQRVPRTLAHRPRPAKGLTCADA